MKLCVVILLGIESEILKLHKYQVIENSGIKIQEKIRLGATISINFIFSFRMHTSYIGKSLQKSKNFAGIKNDLFHLLNLLSTLPEHDKGDQEYRG